MLLKQKQTSTETTPKAPETKITPKEQASAGEGQFSLFGADPSSATQTETVSEFTRKTTETTSHFYQSVASGMATKLFIKNLMNQTSVLFRYRNYRFKSFNSRTRWYCIFMGSW